VLLLVKPKVAASKFVEVLRGVRWQLLVHS
jgi:hypothetical protein